MAFPCESSNLAVYVTALMCRPLHITLHHLPWGDNCGSVIGKGRTAHHAVRANNPRHGRRFIGVLVLLLEGIYQFAGLAVLPTHSVLICIVEILLATLKS